MDNRNDARFAEARKRIADGTLPVLHYGTLDKSGGRPRAVVFDTLAEAEAVNAPDAWYGTPIGAVPVREA